MKSVVHSLESLQLPLSDFKGKTEKGIISDLHTKSFVDNCLGVENKCQFLTLFSSGPKVTLECLLSLTQVNDRCSLKTGS